jgi:hypothetical protein
MRFGDFENRDPETNHDQVKGQGAGGSKAFACDPVMVASEKCEENGYPSAGHVDRRFICRANEGGSLRT